MAGVWLLLDQLGVSSAGQWWPLFWVIAGVFVYLFSSRSRFMTIVAILMVLGGGLARLNIMGLTTVTLDDIFWPVLLILIGVSMFTSHPSISLFGARGRSDDTADKVDYTAIFGGQERRVTSKGFQGGEATAVFGGIDVDLRDAKLADGAALELAAVFGAVKVLVSKDVEVELSGIPIFGGLDDKTVRGGAQKLRITANAVFGGVEIDN